MSAAAPDAAAPQDASLHEDAAGDAKMPVKPIRVLVYSRTVSFRHDTIEVGQRALSDIAARNGGTIDLTEDPLQLAAALPTHDVVVFLMTTGDVLGDEQQVELESFIRGGGGFLGVHSATDTEYDWPFYEELIGARFSDHPAIQPAKLVRESSDHPAVRFLPAIWERTDEWYNFRSNPRGRVQVLMTLDESSYQGGTLGADHPIVWCHTIDRGRAFYTGLGHTQESWQDALFLRHIEAALLWAAGIPPQP
jgi:type 1 glutamine amidotransferase